MSSRALRAVAFLLLWSAACCDSPWRSLLCLPPLSVPCRGCWHCRHSRVPRFGLGVTPCCRYVKFAFLNPRLARRDREAAAHHLAKVPPRVQPGVEHVSSTLMHGLSFLASLQTEGQLTQLANDITANLARTSTLSARSRSMSPGTMDAAFGAASTGPATTLGAGSSRPSSPTPMVTGLLTANVLHRLGTMRAVILTTRRFVVVRGRRVA